MNLSKFFLILLFIVALASCRKEEDFLDIASAQLEFSTDSIAFDTVFTTVGTTTRNFRIYNPYKNSVNISSIRIRGGEQSAFRMNVDGVSGKHIKDVEILPEDSLYVFVEATIDPMNMDNPFFVEDEIEFILNGNVQEIKLLAYGQDAYYIIADTKQKGLPPYKVAIKEGIDTTWTANRPIVIYGYAVVDSAATLRIEAGTKIHFHNNAGLWVFKDATIKVNGIKDNPVTFQGDRLEPAYDNIPGQWDRIWINEGSVGNEFNYAVIKNAFIGLQVEISPLTDTVNTFAFLDIKNTIIQNCSGFGLYTAFSNIHAENLLITNCGQYNVAVLGGGTYEFNHCTFANYFSADRRETPLFYMQNSRVAVPEIKLNNSIIYGANENEFNFDIIDNGDIDFTFRNSILKTTRDVSDVTKFHNMLINPPDNIFVNHGANNFHLSSNSAAIDIGDLNIANTVPLDLDGNLRTVDGNPDAGVYEFQP